MRSSIFQVEFGFCRRAKSQSDDDDQLCMHNEKKKHRANESKNKIERKRTGSFAFEIENESERERQRGERIEHKNNLVLGGKVHRTKEHSKVCRHFVALFFTYTRETHTCYVIYVQQKSVVGRVFYYQSDSKNIYLCLMCTIYV